jgi:hypothetical protein
MFYGSECQRVSRGIRHPHYGQKLFSDRVYYTERMFRTYRAPVRCSEADAEPRFDGVDWSFLLVAMSRTRRGVVGSLTAFGGVGVRLSMIMRV